MADLEKRVNDARQGERQGILHAHAARQGRRHCAKKLGEEAVETGVAAVQERKKRVIAEAADLLYHLLVLLNARGVKLAEVEAELGKRTAQSGHAEKARRRRKS